MKKIFHDIFREQTLYWTIISLIAIGFVTNIDYMAKSGCFPWEEPFLSGRKFFFSLTSLGLLAIGYWISKKWLTTSILIFELLFWILRALVFNEAFNSSLVAFFTMTGLILRILLIIKLRRNRVAG